ncbi:hypothetical protein HETIRDRAFT_115621 [Heterobasidion irregulare TC 32-1]|uniref:Uncharacterized protein n=1 Tax=Heterobasidion irregulare (strain TC 32-1) TaxID=747525 RepID=W4K8L8_HETIT|nr:uncharacterized protein HETIRDRAFT_115621 [Heterobasidion irregulare TC 32-1]ETW82133.1 hypothetical protein HETIRDRAFT_115621 [Heterobasidion irregulare TC 32-1]
MAFKRWYRNRRVLGKQKCKCGRKSNVEGTVDAGLWLWQNAQSVPMLQTSGSPEIAITEASPFFLPDREVRRQGSGTQPHRAYLRVLPATRTPSSCYLLVIRWSLRPSDSARAALPYGHMTLCTPSDAGGYHGLCKHSRALMDARALDIQRGIEGPGSSASCGGLILLIGVGATTVGGASEQICCNTHAGTVFQGIHGIQDDDRDRVLHTLKHVMSTDLGCRPTPLLRPLIQYTRLGRWQGISTSGKGSCEDDRYILLLIYNGTYPDRVKWSKGHMVMGIINRSSGDAIA